MELLEREPALAMLRTCPPGHAVLISGEAGIGKTSLVRAFCLADSRRKLWGGCDALRTPRPLGPLRDIARELGGRMSHALAQDRPAHALFDDFLEELADQPSVVVIEDAHWADDATLDLLLFLARRIDTSSSLLIVTYRDDEVGPDHPLRRVLGGFAGGRARRICLQPLSAGAVSDLVELASAPWLDADELHARTGGNPFFVTEVLADPGSPVPRTVRDAVLARAAALGERERHALYAAAIFPGSTPLSMIESPVDGIDACVGTGILVRDGTRIRFRHELARLAIEGDIPPGRKSALHATALSALRERDADPALLAFHAEEAGDDAAVLIHALAAARRAAGLGAYREAAEHFRQALRNSGGLADREHARALEEYAETCSRLDRDQDAVDLAEQALQRWRAGADAEREVALLARRAYYLRRVHGDGPAARESIDAALELAEKLPEGPALAAAYTGCAVLLMLSYEKDAAVRIGERAAALSERFGERALQSRALNAVGTVQWLGDPLEAERTLMRSLLLARESGDDGVIGVALVNRGFGAGEARLYDSAEQWLREAIEFCSGHDLDGLRRYAEAWLARCLFERGEWEQADDVIAGIDVHGYTCATIVRLTVLGRLRARRGEPGAAKYLDEACELAVKTGELQYIWPAVAGRAELAWLNGDSPGEDVREAYELALRMGHGWAIGELGQWLDVADMKGDLHLAATPYRLEPDGAARAWLEAGCPFEAAMAMSKSRERWPEALTRLEHLGARSAIDRLVRLGREDGRRPPRSSTMTHPNGLTRRQADVLDLLGKGLRNAEIAARLHISTKTVDHHVSAILAKLGVSSRREAAAYRADNSRP